MAKSIRYLVALVVWIALCVPTHGQVQTTFSENLIQGSPAPAQFTLVKMNALGGGQVSAISAGSSTSGILGIVRTGVVPSNGLVSVVIAGLAYCTFDSSSVTQLDYVYAAGTGGKCHDGGASYPNGIQAIGMVIGSTVPLPNNPPLPANTFQIQLFPPEIRGGSGGGVTCPGCTINDIMLWNGSNLANSALSDDGTTVNSSEAFRAPIITDSSLTPGRCVQTAIGGQFATAAGACNTSLTAAGSNGQGQANNSGNLAGSGAVLYADVFSGATWDAKITNAIAALPVGGGTIDARGLCPSPTGPAAANLVLGSQSQPVQLLLGPCTYALGAHQIKYFNQTKILGTTGTNSTAGSVITFTGSGTAIIGGISSGANIYGIDFENFTVSGDTTTGSTGFDLTYIFQGTVEKVSTIGTDIGGTLGGTGTCACYNIFPQDDFNGISFGFKLGQTANQDSFYGGSAVASVGDGYDLNQSSTDYFYDVDSESDGNSAIHLESNTGTIGVFGGYFENANKGILLDSGSNNNYIVGVGAVINITDNSGQTNNYYNWVGAISYWPLNFAVQQGLYFGRSITGTGTNSWLYLTAGADGPLSLINQLLNAEIYGLYGHGGIVVGSIQNTSGVQDTGLLSVNILNYNNAVTATKVGATGSTSYGPYYVVCHDANGGVSPDPNASNTITNGAATLTSSNYIQVTWNVLDGCKTWDILRGDQSHSVAVNVQVPTNSGQSQHVYQDQSNSTSAYSLPARNTTGDATIAGNVTAAQVIAPIVVTAPQTATYSSSSATFNAANGSEATLTISANVTITLSGCTAGQHLFLKMKYTGSFTPTFAVGGSDTLNFNANGAPTFTAANNKTDIIGFDCQSNGSGIDYDALPASLGYSH